MSTAIVAVICSVRQVEHSPLSAEVEAAYHREPRPGSRQVRRRLPAPSGHGAGSRSQLAAASGATKDRTIPGEG